MHKTLPALVAATALATGLPALSQTFDAGEIIVMNAWDTEALYTDGISIDRMMDEYEVYSPIGEEIGSVENVLFDADGRVLSIIAQVGGFWDIGDTHVNVPWDQVEIDRAGRVVIPVTEETVDDYSAFADEVISAPDATGSVEAVDDDVTPIGQVWRATDLIGDYARLREGDEYLNYGYINDMIVRGGEVVAVTVEPRVGMRPGGAYGPRAYPYYGYGYGWTPATPYYNLPYTQSEIADVERFDYERFDAER